MLGVMARSRAFAAATAVLLLSALLAWRAAPSAEAGTTGLGGADPSVIRVGSRYVAAKSVDGGIAIRTASTLEGIAAAPKHQVWKDSGGLGEVWAPEIVYDAGRYQVYFSAGTGGAHRMYQISSAGNHHRRAVHHLAAPRAVGAGGREPVHQRGAGTGP
jgi:beta-xylosidase